MKVVLEKITSLFCFLKNFEHEGNKKVAFTCTCPCDV